ncbi:MAG: tetratricopeptide repeat protein [Bacteroidetes bacterium]|nr:MAG: tetratricopeptide repeat protein [Bacteroidota bacterium]
MAALKYDEPRTILAMGNMQKLILSLAILLGITSCSQKNQRLSTQEFQDVVRSLNTIRSAKYQDQLIPSLDSAFELVEHRRPLDWYEYYDMHAWNAWVDKDLESALSYTDSMILVLTPVHGVESEYLHALVQKGILYQDLNFYSEALKSYFTASAYAEKYMDKCGSGEVHYNLAKILYIQGNYSDAIQYFQKAFESSQACDSKGFDQFYFIGQGSLNALGLCYENLNEWELAKESYQKALHLIDKHSESFPNEKSFSLTAKAVIQGNLGNTERLLGNYQEAIRLFEASILINKQGGEDLRDAIYTEIKLAKLYAQMGEPQKSLEITDTVAKLLQLNPDMEAQIRLADLRSEVYFALGDPGNSLQSIHIKKAYQDSQAMARRELPSLNVPASLSYLQQKQELQDLKKRQDRIMQVLISALFVLGVAIVILVLIRRNQKAAKRHGEALSQKNEELNVKNQQLIQTMSDLEASQEENARILKIVAHDLRSPVTGINTLASLLLDSDKVNKDNRTEIEMIHKVSNDSLKFMEEVLNVNNKFRKEDKTPTDLLDLVEYCANYMQHKAAEKKQHIEIKGNHIFLPIYRERVWRALNNLISNAIKFSPEGGLIEVQITESLSTIRICVKDQGIGIPEEMKKQIFAVDSNEGRKGTSGEHSFGLGLAISLQIMEAHEGRLWFESEENKGTTFIMEFPRPGSKVKIHNPDVSTGFNLN